MDTAETFESGSSTVKAPFRSYGLVAVQMIRRHGLTVVLTTILGAAIALIYLFVSNPVYEAKAELLVKFGREYVYRPEFEGLDGWQPSRMIELVNGEVRILNSRNVKARAVEKIGSLRLYPGLASTSSFFKFDLTRLKNLSNGNGAQSEAASSPEADAKHLLNAAVDRLDRDLNIRALGDSSIVLVAYRHADPEIAQETLSALLDAYRERRMEVFSGPSASAAASLFKQATAEFEKAQNDLANFLETHEPELANPKLTASNELAAQLYQTLLETNASLVKRRDALVRVSDELMTIGATPKSGSTRTAAIQNVEERLEHLLRDALVISQVAGTTSPAAVALRQREADLSARMLEAYLPRRTADEALRERALTLFAAQLALKKEVIAGEQERDQTLQIISDLRSEVASIERDRQKLDILQGAVAVAKERFESAQRNLQQANDFSLLNTLDSGSVAIIDSPVVPQGPEGISWLTRVVIAAVLGAIAGIGLAILSEITPATITPKS